MGDSRNDRILVVPDMHHPYAHVDCVPFLAALKKSYKPTRVICLGDEVDKHAMSFHDSDPDLFSAGHELAEAIKKLKPLYSLFPQMDLLASNHGSLLYRKAVHHGIPRKYLRDYREILDAPKGWTWHKQIIVKHGAHSIFFTHGLTKDVMKLVHRTGMSAVQGHFHTDFCIRYTAGYQGGARFGMTSGCLIDDEALAFAYNKMHLERPILGASTITAGNPRLYQMNLNASRRWDRKIT